MTVSRSICVPADGIILFFFYGQVYSIAGFPGSSVVKNLPANGGDTGELPGGENGNHSSILAQ